MKAVIILQKLVLDPSSKLSDILRHAYLIACKLNLKDFKKWCELELNGYFYVPEENIPDYRFIFGSLCLKNTLNNSKTILKADSLFSGQIIREGVYFFEEAINAKDEIIKIQLKDDMDELLRNKNPQLKYAHFVFYLELSKAPFQKVLDIIKFKILEISNQLEKEGILGEEWEFTEKEKLMTHNVTYNIDKIENMANHNSDSFIISHKLENGK